MKGLNIGVGPSVGYSFQSREWQADYIPYNSSSNIGVRRSYLEYVNSVIVGYRISAGYDWEFKNGLLTGVRLDFSNYTNGDINTFAGIKLGYKF